MDLNCENTFYLTGEFYSYENVGREKEYHKINILFPKLNKMIPFYLSEDNISLINTFKEMERMTKVILNGPIGFKADNSPYLRVNAIEILQK